MNANENHYHSVGKPALRMTRRRRAILESAEVFGRAFTVEELTAMVRADAPGTGLATVYRGVAALADAGLLTRVGERNGSALYVRCSAAGHHHHLVCTGCGRVARADCLLGKATVAAAAAQGFSITGHEMTLWGVCAGCAELSAHDRKDASRS